MFSAVPCGLCWTVRDISLDAGVIAPVVQRGSCMTACFLHRVTLHGLLAHCVCFDKVHVVDLQLVFLRVGLAVADSSTVDVNRELLGNLRLSRRPRVVE
jgi:hypothetical protein